MFNLKPELREGEAVIGEYGATVYMVRNGLSSRGSNIVLWLTNQRLILKAGLGPQRTLSLHAIANIREERVALHNMVRIEFVGGHLEWFTVQTQAQFVQALMAAQAQAPEIPESIAAPSSNLTNPSSSGKWVVLIAIVVACVFMALCAMLTALGGFWFILSTR